MLVAGVIQIWIKPTIAMAIYRPNNIFAVPLLHTAAAVVGVKLEPIRQSRL